MDSKNLNNKEKFSHKVGDQIEKLGKKITDAGAQKIGKAVYNTGNSIEHMNDEESDVTSTPSTTNRPV